MGGGYSVSGERYSLPVIALHWVHVGLIIALVAIGWMMTDLPKGQERSAAYALHKSLGLCALALILMRFAWRRFQTPPAPSAQLLPWERWLSVAVHRALYALLLLVPLAGYLSASFTKYPMKWFGVVLPSVAWPDETLNAFFSVLHKGAVWALMFLLFLHVAAALQHALRRDGVMSRMLPWCSRQA